jgi:hypothetical protein
MKLLELFEHLKLRREFFLFDDFESYTDGQRWTKLCTGGGATVAAGATGQDGTLVLTTGGTDNNEAAFATTNKPFLFAAEVAHLFETKLQYAEANTNTAGVALGFSSVMNTTGMLADTTLAPVGSFSGAILYKKTGDTTWSFRVSVGSAKVDIATQHTAGGAAAQRLKIEIRQGQAAAGSLEAVPWLDGQIMLDTSSPGRPIKLIVPTGGAAMQAGIFMKTHSTSSEFVTVDYVAAGKLRV